MPHNPTEYISRRISDRLVEFEHPSGVGTALVAYDMGKRTLCLYDMNVMYVYRNQGIGKELLQFTKYVAQQIGATSVAASITSREAYQAATSVFGDDCMHIKQLTNFTEPVDDSEPGKPYSSNVTMQYKVEEA